MRKKLASGVKKLSEYGIWNSMRQRCGNPKNKSFAHYGGRGIHVCESWQVSFAAFYSDMGARPSATHSLDRVDRNGPYAPKNCRWATPVEQANNHGRNTIIGIDGVEKTIADWSRETGVERHVISRRINALDWNPERAATEAVGRQVAIGGRSQTVAQWCRELGIDSDAVYQRVKKLGWPFEKAISTPVGCEKLISCNGETATATQWSARTGIQKATILARLKYGWAPERALTEPAQPRRPKLAHS